MPTTQLRRANFPYGGRLIVLESGRTTNFDPFAGLQGFTSIDFPAMPDSIELARSVEYLVVNSQVMPDGIHQYKWTNPLSIPFAFKLHSFDKDFCPKGALSLLELSGLLHSLTLPLSQNKSGLKSRLSVTMSQSKPGTAPNNSADAQAARGQAADSAYNVTPDSQSDFYPPVTVRLELIFTEDQKAGITCTGYVKDVKARLLGPWLRGPGESFNLPTAGEFEFTFVHVPGHGNDFKITAGTLGQNATIAQAYGDDVKDKLYNTREMTLISDRSYKGFTQ